MSVMSTATKARIGTKAAKGALRRPGVARLGARAYAPIVKRRTRRRIGSIGGTAREYGELLVNYGPSAAQELGLVSAPKAKHTAPRVAAGVIIGAGAMYFLEPEHGAEHREKARSLVS